tara:strand:+ start:73416 stop:73652 length:237 start_codon:yes stop_codon:yes gene_type:complete
VSIGFIGSKAALFVHSLYKFFSSGQDFYAEIQDIHNPAASALPVRHQSSPHSSVDWVIWDLLALPKAQEDPAGGIPNG